MALIYHITHMDNLAAIVQSGGLYATNTSPQSSVSVAYGHIQERRAKKAVPFGGVLHDYVPFYFCPRSPMLYAIHSQTAQMLYKGGQQPMLHLVSNTESTVARGLPCVFSDRHAVLDYAEFFDDMSLLPTQLDWTAIRATFWFNSGTHPERKERKQAEFLVRHFLPFDLIQSIGVYDSSHQEQAQTILAQLGLAAPPIQLQRNWYY
jgi:hypothetical protein